LIEKDLKTINPDGIKSASNAAFGLFKWVSFTVNLYKVNKQVEPLKKRLALMTK